MCSLCLPGQTLAGRPAGLLTPRHTQSCFPAGRVKGLCELYQFNMDPPPGRNMAHSRVQAGWRQSQSQGECCWSGSGDMLACASHGLPGVGSSVFCKSLGLCSFLTLSVWIGVLLWLLAESGPMVLLWDHWRDQRRDHRYSFGHSDGPNLKANIKKAWSFFQWHSQRQVHRSPSSPKDSGGCSLRFCVSTSGPVSFSWRLRKRNSLPPLQFRLLSFLQQGMWLAAFAFQNAAYMFGLEIEPALAFREISTEEKTNAL